MRKITITITETDDERCNVELKPTKKVAGKSTEVEDNTFGNVYNAINRALTELSMQEK